MSTQDAETVITWGDLAGARPCAEGVRGLLRFVGVQEPVWLGEMFPRDVLGPSHVQGFGDEPLVRIVGGWTRDAQLLALHTPLRRYLGWAWGVGLLPMWSMCGAGLRHASLTGADLCNADLRGADLRRADLCDASLRVADLCDADLRNADLRGADLTDTDIRSTDLSGTELGGAKLRGARR